MTSMKRKDLQDRARNEDKVIPWLEGTVLPAFEGIAERLGAVVTSDLDVPASRASVKIVIDPNGLEEFSYSVSVDNISPQLAITYQGRSVPMQIRKWPVGVGRLLTTIDQDETRNMLGIRYSLVTGKMLPIED